MALASPCALGPTSRPVKFPPKKEAYALAVPELVPTRVKKPEALPDCKDVFPKARNSTCAALSEDWQKALMRVSTKLPAPPSSEYTSPVYRRPTQEMMFCVPLPGVMAIPFAPIATAPSPVTIFRFVLSQLHPAVRLPDELVAPTRIL